MENFMKESEKSNFNEQMRERTMNMAANVRDLFKEKEIESFDKSYVSQLIRCSSSVAANYSAATRGRSDAEFYSKICIVVEEADETKFWINFLLRLKILADNETKEIRDESDQLVRIFSSIKAKMKRKLEGITDGTN